MNRRRYLAAVASGGVSGVAGCALLESTVRLAGVAGTNFASGPRRLEVRVLEGGSEIQTAELEVPPAEEGDGYVVVGQASVDCEWSSDSGAFAVEARGNRDWETFDVAAAANDDCVVVDVAVGDPDRPTFRVDPCDDVDLSGYGCRFAVE